ncbi:uncharacterized protein LOC141702275 [Apium graveolens]|uniref:uncharacterized protein LOC141702275 n=1 Tax=Apium graveolens TaxID=4045 RepID=UPI003D7C0765
MDVEGEKWVTLPRYSDKYRMGVKAFITNAFSEYASGNELKCPCRKCSNRYWYGESVIKEHLICNGVCPQSTEWIYEVSNHKNNDVDDNMDSDIGMGLADELEAMIRNTYENCNNDSEHGVRKGLDDDAKKFYRLVEEGGQPLYPECLKFTRLSFIVRLYQLKCIHGFKFQAVADDPKVLSEYKNFLGTLARESVPLDYISWHKYPESEKERLWQFVNKKYIIPEEGRTFTLQTINDLWRLHKSRVKKDHYLQYDNDEDRLKNKPSFVSTEVFKVLLKYWGDEEIQRRSKTASENRALIVETHTAGRTSFAQIGEKIKAENKIEPKEPAPSDLVYVETRKRKPGRKYKTTIPTDDKDENGHAQHDIEDGSHGANNSAHTEKKSKKPAHGPNWLIGRSGRTRKTVKLDVPAFSQSSSASIDVADLKKSIKEELLTEMQEIIDKKVREKLSKVIGRLGDIVPDFNDIAVQELYSDVDEGQSEGGEDINAQ